MGSPVSESVTTPLICAESFTTPRHNTIKKSNLFIIYLINTLIVQLIKFVKIQSEIISYKFHSLKNDILTFFYE